MAGGRLENDKIFWFFSEDLEDDLERLLQIIQFPRRLKERHTLYSTKPISANAQLSVSNDNSIRVNLLKRKVKWNYYLKEI